MSIEVSTIEDERSLDSSQKQSEDEIRFESIRELERPIRTIIEKIRDRIENGEYDLIIGDDASGRIPTLILGNFIRKVSEQKNQEKPNIIFIPGKLKINFPEQDKPSWKNMFNLVKKKRSQDEKLDEGDKLETYLTKQGATRDKRILIVTDTVKSGSSLGPLVKLLKISGYACDIATIGIEPEEELDYGARNVNLGSTEIISGEYEEEGTHTPEIYGRSELSGVVKQEVVEEENSKSEVRSIPYKDTEEGAYGDDSDVQRDINQTRADANIVTKDLIDWYESRTKSSSPS